MNNSLLNNLQLYRGRRFSDLVDENMISNALLTKPHEVSGLLSLVFGTKDDGVSTAIDLITGGLGKTMIIENREFEWSVMIDSLILGHFHSFLLLRKQRCPYCHFRSPLCLRLLLLDKQQQPLLTFLNLLNC